MNPHDFSIVLQRIVLDGEQLFEATVLEFPDLAVYEANADDAYTMALEMIEGLIAMAEDMNHPIPTPRAREDELPSGKITFRPGRQLHRNIAIAAERDGVSINQWLCNAASSSAAATKITHVVRQEIAGLGSHIGPGFFQLAPALIRKPGALTTIGFGPGPAFTDPSEMMFEVDEDPLQNIASAATGEAGTPINLLIAAAERA